MVRRVVVDLGLLVLLLVLWVKEGCTEGRRAKPYLDMLKQNRGKNRGAGLGKDVRHKDQEATRAEVEVEEVAQEWGALLEEEMGPFPRWWPWGGRWRGGSSFGRSLVNHLGLGGGVRHGEL